MRCLLTLYKNVCNIKMMFCSELLKLLIKGCPTKNLFLNFRTQFVRKSFANNYFTDTFLTISSQLRGLTNSFTFRKNK